MKLLTKTSIYYLVFTAFLFTSGGYFFYNRLRNVIDEDYTENLYLEKDVIIKYTEDSSKLPVQEVFLGDKMEFFKTDFPAVEVLKDTMVFNAQEEEMQLVRRLEFPVKTGNYYYKAMISKSMFESEDLIENIVYPFAVAAFLTMIILFVFTWLLQKQMWKPFYTSLSSLKHFDAKQSGVLSFHSTGTQEFSILNSEIEKMTSRISNDYKTLKEFTENASHEIQTPLAVIRSKMEMLIQSEELSEAQSKAVLEMLTSITRLSKLNESLLLLSKIDNEQFIKNEFVNLAEIINNKILFFEDMLSFRNITIEKRINADPKIKMNQNLADVLFNNLISNAIKHNFNGGKILIEVSYNSVVISNSGNAPVKNPGDMFERFSKESTSKDSAGLGLAISKKICELSGIQIVYTFADNLHKISLVF